MTVYGGDKTLVTDINPIEARTILKPLVRIAQQSAQSLANSTDTAITFGSGSTGFDTHDFHDESTNNSRVTPTVAGYYRVTGTVFVAASAALTSLIATIGKNGTVQAPRHRFKPGTANVSASAQVSVILTANGTTDYFELFGQQTTGGALNTTTGGSFTSVLEVEFLRDL
jgi:hypothetical protein